MPFYASDFRRWGLMDPSVAGPEHGSHLEALECNVFLLNDVACIELKEKYSYVGPPPEVKDRDLQNLLYVFPPGRDAVLCDVQGRLGKRPISSHIQEQSLDGRRVKPTGYEYNPLESNEERQFDLRYAFLGKLCPGEDAEIIVTYTFNCDVKEGTLLFTLPHMYCPPAQLKKCRSTDTSDSDKITNKERKLREAYPLTFAMLAYIQGETTKLSSKNGHRLLGIFQRRGEAIPYVAVNLISNENDTPSVEDLVIEFKVSFFADPSLYLLPPAVESTGVNMDAAVLTFEEGFFRNARIDLIMVVDFPKKPLQAEIEHARAVIGGLLSAMMDLEKSQRERIFFNIYFQCTTRTVTEATRGLASLNEGAVNNANAVFQKLDSAFSGTDQLGMSVSCAFEELLQQRKAATDKQLRVLLLTNGWSEESLASAEHKNGILEAVGKYGHYGRLFLALIGKSTEHDQDFAECITCAGNGRTVVVPPEENTSESFFQKVAADILEPRLCKCHLPEEFVHLSQISFDTGAAKLTKLHALRNPSIAPARNPPAIVTMHGTKFNLFDCSNCHRLAPRMSQSVMSCALLDAGNDCFNPASAFPKPASVVSVSQKFRVEAPMTNFVVCSETERLRMPRLVLVNMPQMAHFSLVRRAERKFCSFVERCYEEIIKPCRPDPVQEEEAGSSQRKEEERSDLVRMELENVDLISQLRRGRGQISMESRPLTELETGMERLVGVGEKSKEEPPSLPCVKTLDVDIEEFLRQEINTENQPPPEPETGSKQLASMNEGSPTSRTDAECQRTTLQKVAALEERLNDVMKELTTCGDFAVHHQEQSLALKSTLDSLKKEFAGEDTDAWMLSEEKMTQCIQLATMFDDRGAFNGGELLAALLGLDSVEELVGKNPLRGEVGDDHWLTFVAMRHLAPGLLGDDYDFLMETIRRVGCWIEEQSIFFFQSRHALLDKMITASRGEGMGFQLMLSQGRLY